MEKLSFAQEEKIINSSVVVKKINCLNNAFNKFDLKYTNPKILYDRVSSKNEFDNYTALNLHVLLIHKNSIDYRKQRDKNALADRYKELFYNIVKAFSLEDEAIFSKMEGISKSSAKAVITNYVNSHFTFCHDANNFIYLIKVNYNDGANELEKEVRVNAEDLAIPYNGKMQTINVDLGEYEQGSFMRTSKLSAFVETDLSGKKKEATPVESNASFESGKHYLLKYYLKKSSENNGLKYSVDETSDGITLKVNGIVICSMYPIINNAYRFRLHAAAEDVKPLFNRYRCSLFITEANIFEVVITSGFDCTEYIEKAAKFIVENNIVKIDGVYYALKEVAGIIDKKFQKGVEVDGLIYKNIDGIYSVCGSTNSGSSLTIKPTFNPFGKDYRIGAIADSAFAENQELENLQISGDSMKLSSSCFKNCSNLSKINLSGVRVIGPYAFAGCYSLKKIVIPDSVIEIDEYAFDSCFSLEEIVIPASVKKVGKNILQQCNLCKVVIVGKPKFSGWDSHWNSGNLEIIYK